MKRIVICCDGTWGTPESAIPSNVVKTARAVLPSTPNCAQVVFYDWGIGSESGQRLSGGSIGSGIDKNIQDAYRFLCHNYTPGDEIFLFGFSRGAYTVRSLVGMIRNCGLLPKHLEHKVVDAYKLYRSHDDVDSLEAMLFRMDNWEVNIKFLGVWDTVGALGVPFRLTQLLFKYKYGFHDTRLSSIVENAYHALALDESKRVFAPTLWTTDVGRTRTEQRWFPGEHSDIGGGSENVEASNKTFHWMMEHAGNCGLELDQLYLRQLRGGKLKEEKTGTSFLGIFGRKKRVPLVTNHDETSERENK